MLQGVYRWFDRIAGWGVLASMLVLTGVAAAAFRADIPGSTVPLTQRLGRLPMLDSRLFYTAGEARAVWEALGADGRRAGLLLPAWGAVLRVRESRAGAGRSPGL